MNSYFDTIYDGTYREVLIYVISRCSDLSCVENIMQNIYLNLYKTIDNKGNDYIFNQHAYAIKLADKELYRHYYHKNRTSKVRFINDTNLKDNIDEKCFVLDDQAFKDVSIESIWGVLKDEDVISQKIMVLYYLGSMTVTEIASLLELSERLVKNKLFNIISKIREKFDGNHEQS